MSSISEYYWRKQKHDSQRYAVDLRTVHATENVQFSPAPRHNFSRGDELSSDNPIRRGKRALLAEGDVGLFFLFFSECSSTLYDQYTRKYYFPNVGGTILPLSHFWGRHSEPLRFARSNFLRFYEKRKNDKDTGQKSSPGRRRESRNLWNPPMSLKKKQSGKRSLPLAVPQVELLSDFYEKRKLDRYSRYHNGRFWADFGQILCCVLGDHPSLTRF